MNRDYDLLAEKVQNYSAILKFIVDSKQKVISLDLTKVKEDFESFLDQVFLKDVFLKFFMHIDFLDYQKIIDSKVFKSFAEFKLFESILY
jgi:hypothetical protein